MLVIWQNVSFSEVCFSGKLQEGSFQSLVLRDSLIFCCVYLPYQYLDLLCSCNCFPPRHPSVRHLFILCSCVLFWQRVRNVRLWWRNDVPDCVWKIRSADFNGHQPQYAHNAVLLEFHALVQLSPSFQTLCAPCGIFL